MLLSAIARSSLLTKTINSISPLFVARHFGFWVPKGMQNADAYSEVNKNTEKYSGIINFLKVHEDAMDWKPDEIILDVGCGPGDVTAQALQKWLPSNFRYLLGVDVSAKMIKHAQATNANEKLEFATFDMGSDISGILKKERYSEGFDKIFSFYVFHWLDDLEKAMGNLYSSMKPGGLGLVTFPIDRYFQKTFKRVRTKPQWSGLFKNVHRELPPFPRSSQPALEFQEMLESAGFQVTKCETHTSYCVFESADKFKGLIESLDADIECVPADKMAAYLTDCFQIMEEMKAIRVENKAVTQTKIMLTSVFRRPT